MKKNIIIIITLLIIIFIGLSQMEQMNKSMAELKSINYDMRQEISNLRNSIYNMEQKENFFSTQYMDVIDTNIDEKTYTVNIQLIPKEILKDMVTSKIVLNNTEYLLKYDNGKLETTVTLDLRERIEEQFFTLETATTIINEPTNIKFFWPADFIIMFYAHFNGSWNYNSLDMNGDLFITNLEEKEIIDLSFVIALNGKVIKKELIKNNKFKVATGKVDIGANDHLEVYVTGVDSKGLSYEYHIIDAKYDENGKVVNEMMGLDYGNVKVYFKDGEQLQYLF